MCYKAVMALEEQQCHRVLAKLEEFGIAFLSVHHAPKDANTIALKVGSGSTVRSLWVFSSRVAKHTQILAFSLGSINCCIIISPNPSVTGFIPEINMDLSVSRTVSFPKSVAVKCWSEPTPSICLVSSSEKRFRDCCSSSETAARRASFWQDFCT